jgi:uncharacterized Zn finger protein
VSVEIIEAKPTTQWDSYYVVCPYCGAQHGDCFEWVKETADEMDCDECGKRFSYYAEYHVTYISKPYRDR